MKFNFKNDLTLSTKINGHVINLTLLFILLTASFFRLWKVESLFYFAEEANNVLYTIESFVNGKHSILLGLEATGYLHHLFHTPWYLYFWSTLFLILEGEPLFFAYLHSSIGIVSAFLIYKIGEKLGNKKFGYIAALIYSLNSMIIHLDRSVWAVGLIPFSVILAIYLLIIAFKKEKTIYFLLLGVWLGIALSFHYQFSLVILGIMILILMKKKNNLLPTLIPIFISLIPIIIFDLRHNFFNLYGFYLWVKVTLEGGSPYGYRNYFIFSYPVVILIVAYLLAKIRLNFIVILLIIIYAYTEFKPSFIHPPTLPGSYVERNKLVSQMLDHYSNGLEIFFKDEDSYEYRYLLFLRARQRNYDVEKIKIYEPWQLENSADLTVETGRLLRANQF